MKNKRLWYFDVLKIISAIAVVLIHVISEYWYALDINSINFKILTILDSCCRFCVPIYLMISGALFLDENKIIDLKYLFKHYILRIFLIFIIWNLIYSLLNITILQNGTLSFPVLLDSFVSTFLGKGIFHLKFLVIILGFYLCVPIFKLITKKVNKQQLEYFILLLFVFTSLNRLVANIWNVSLHYPILFSGYILYFILGYYLHNFEFNKKTNNIIYILGFVSLIFTCFLSIKYSVYLNYPSEVFFDYLSPNIVIISSSLFVFCRNNIKNNNDNNKFIYKLSNLYFGVYLIHGLVLGFYLNIGLFNIQLPLGILVFILTIIIFSTSLILSYVISKIPYINKLIIL